MGKLWGRLFLLSLILLGLSVLALRVYDFDPLLRPWLEKLIANAPNTEAKVQKVQISLWGGIGLKAEGLEIKFGEAKNLRLQSEEFHLSMPYLSLLRGVFRVKLKFNQADLNLPKHSLQAKNIEKLLDILSVDARKQSALHAKSLPFFWKRLELSLFAEQLRVHVEDVKSGRLYTFSQLSLENIGENRNSKISLELSSESFINDKLRLQGGLTGEGYLRWLKTERELIGDLAFNLKNLQMDYGNILRKDVGKDLSLELNAKYHADRFQIEQASFVVNNQRLRLMGSFNELSGNIKSELKLVSSFMELRQWQGIFFPLGFYDFSGLLSMSVDLYSNGDKFNYNGNIRLTEGGMSLPGVKNQFTTLRLDLDFANSNYEVKELSFANGKTTARMSFSSVNDKPREIMASAAFGSLDLEDLFADLSDEDKLSRIARVQLSQARLSEEEKAILQMNLADGFEKAGFLNSISASWDVRATELYWRNILLRNASANLELKQGKLKLTKGISDLMKGKLGFIGLGYFRSGRFVQEIKAKFANLDSSYLYELGTWLPNDLFTGMSSGDISIELDESLRASGRLQLVQGSFLPLKVFSGFEEMIYRLTRVSDRGDSVSISKDFHHFNANYRYSKEALELNNFETKTKPNSVSLLGDIKMNKSLFLNAKSDVYFSLNRVPTAIRSRGGLAKIQIPFSGPIASPEISWQQQENKLAPYFRGQSKTKVKPSLEKASKTQILKNKNAKEYIKKLEP